MFENRKLVKAALALAVCSSLAGAQTFFGLSTGGGPSTRVPSRAAADAARTSFMGSLVGVGTEDFEGIAAGTPPPIGLVCPGAGTATLVSPLGGSVTFQGPGTNGVGRYPSSGVHFFNTGSASSGPTFHVDFSTTVAAFGFYGIDVGDFGSQLSLKFWLAGVVVDTWALPYLASSGTGSLMDGSMMYAGYIRTSGFDRVDFVGTSSADFFAFDDMTVGSVESVHPTVPEPASLALLGTGLIGLYAVARRRRA